MNKLTSVVIFACLFVTVSQVRSDLVLDWSQNNVVSSGPITVDLLLIETGTTLINDFGVSGASYTVTRAGAGTLETPVSLAPMTFDASIPAGSDPIVSLNQTSIFGAGVGGGNQLVVGTFVVNPTSTGVGALTVSEFGSNADFTVFTDASFNQAVLDATVLPSAPVFSYTFTAVPEASSFLCLSVAGVFSVSTYLVRQRRSSAASD